MSEGTKPDAAYCDASLLESEQAKREAIYEAIVRALLCPEQYAGHRAFLKERAARMTLCSIIDRCNERPWVPG